MVGYDSDKDYLLDPQQKKDKFPAAKYADGRFFTGKCSMTIPVRSGMDTSAPIASRRSSDRPA